MPKVGDLAPDFELTGVVGGDTRRYRLSEETDSGNYVLLVFYPADFSPVCTAEMCAIRDSDFFTFTEGISVWGVCGDSLYAHRAFAAEFDLTFPLLADTDHSVAAAYGACYDQWEGQPEMTKRGIFLVDSDRRFRYIWRSEDAYVEPDLWPVKEALDLAQNGEPAWAADPDADLSDPASKDVDPFE